MSSRKLKRRRSILSTTLIRITFAEDVNPVVISVTRSGDLLDFGHFLKPLATINMPKSSQFSGNFCKGVKIYDFLVKPFLGNVYRHLAIFAGHTGGDR